MRAGRRGSDEGTEVARQFCIPVDPHRGGYRAPTRSQGQRDTLRSVTRHLTISNEAAQKITQIERVLFEQVGQSQVDRIACPHPCFSFVAQ